MISRRQQPYKNNLIYHDLEYQMVASKHFRTEAELCIVWLLLSA